MQTDPNDPRVKLMQKWSKEMPEYSQAISGKAARRSSQEEDDDDVDDDDDESDTKSVNSIQSAFSIRSNASKSSYLSAGPRKLSRTRRIAKGPAQPNASTATQQTTAVAPAAQGAVATTQPKKGRGKKGKKGKGPKVTEIYLPIGGGPDGFTPINKENARAWIKKSAAQLAAIDKGVNDDLNIDIAFVGYTAQPFIDSLSKVYAGDIPGHIAAYNKAIEIIAKLRTKRFITQNRLTKKKLDDAMNQTGLNAEQYSVYNRAKLRSLLSGEVCRLFKTIFLDTNNTKESRKAEYDTMKVKNLNQYVLKTPQYEQFFNVYDIERVFVHAVNKCRLELTAPAGKNHPSSHYSNNKHFQKLLDPSSKAIQDGKAGWSKHSDEFTELDVD